MKRFRIYSILACGCLWAMVAAAQPPKELIQYIQDARKSGASDRQIEQNASRAGWESAIVRDAIEYLRNPKAAIPAAASPAPAEKSKAEVPDTAGKSKPAGPAADASAAPTKPAESAEPPAGTPPAGDPKTTRPDRGVPDEYIIGEGDVLHINVWKEPDASVQSAVVRPDGKISMPMLKDVKVSGLTPAELEADLAKQLSAFISAADVTVVVSAINSKKIYVVGSVKKEGPIPFTYRMTVLQALSEAGGLSDYAKKKKIYVLRHENGRDYQLPFDYDAVLRGERMELNWPLKPGDTIVVPH